MGVFRIIKCLVAKLSIDHFLEAAEKEKAGPGESIAIKNKHPKPPMAESRHLRWL